jgi:1-acyl-sn-glycerol-3-phosphate acyltransferase
LAIVDFKPGNFRPYRKATELITAHYLEWHYRTFYGPLTIIGREDVPKGQFLIVGNHLSNWDPPMLVIATHRPMGFVAKEELFTNNPRFGKLIEFYGSISVRRGKPEKSTFKSVKKMFQAGWSCGMFIEGTRSKTPGIMGKPHLGPAYFARANNVPILPVGINGTNQKGAHATARVGKPFPAGEDLEATTWQIMETLSSLTGFKIESRELASQMDDE